MNRTVFADYSQEYKITDSLSISLRFIWFTVNGVKTKRTLKAKHIGVACYINNSTKLYGVASQFFGKPVKASLDNRRENLRPCTNKQNHQNIGKMKKKTSSRYKGVSIRNNKWRAVIRVNGRHKELGLFKSEDDAARAYDKAAIDNFGEFANINFKMNAGDGFEPRE